MTSLSKTIFTVAVAASAFALSVPASAQNLIQNGGFEGAPAPVPPGYGETPPNGTQSVTPWVGTNVDVVSNSFFGAGFAHGGSQTLDLVGRSDTNGGVGSIYQNFATVVGESYVLNFFYSRNIASANNGTLVATLADTASLGSPFFTSVALSNPTASPGNPAWLQYTATFTAVSALTRLTFTGNGANNGGPVIDDVSVAAAAPEPATWGMMILGFGIAGTALRIRRRRPALVA